MKLNLGSGTHPTDLPGWLNVDLTSRRCHVAADALALPFARAAFEAAYLGHFLEHIRWADLAALGVEIRRVVRRGGRVMVVGPDLVRALVRREPDAVLDAIADIGPGPERHKWLATQALTLDACRELRLRRIRAVNVAEVGPPEYPNPSRVGWQCAVEATV